MLAVTGLKSDVHVRFFFLAFGALGTKSKRGQKGELYVAALAAGASLGVWRGSLVSGFFFRYVFCGFCLIYTHVGGYGFKTRCVRAINCLGFLCFGDQVTAREKRRVMCGRTGGGCEFEGLPWVAYFPFFVVACIAVLV